MSGVLARLVARARGAEPSGLRPRLPARFEAAPAPETAESVAAWEAGERPAPRGWTAPEAARGPAASAPPEQATVRASPAPGAADPPSPDAPARRLRSGVREPGEIPATPTAEPVRSSAAPPGVPSAAAPGSRPTSSMTASAEPAPPAPIGAQPSAAAPRGLDPHLPAPPPPLMPVAPTAWPLLAAPALPLPRPPPAAATGSRAAPSAAEPPEIVIQIGRIDLTAVTGPAATPRPRRGRPPLTSLADYLRRDGGAR